jgi:hypothetical protein
VTDAAIFRGGQVTGVFALGGNAIVAGGAVVHHAGVIEHAGGKTAYAMTHPAILGGGNVRRRLA